MPTLNITNSTPDSQDLQDIAAYLAANNISPQTLFEQLEVARRAAQIEAETTKWLTLLDQNPSLQTLSVLMDPPTWAVLKGLLEDGEAVSDWMTPAQNARAAIQADDQAAFFTNLFMLLKSNLARL